MSSSMTVQPTQFRKKPVVIEALQYDGTEESGSNLAVWINHDGVNRLGYQRVGVYKPMTEYTTELMLVEYVDKPFIQTLEGDLLIEVGDFVIKGVKGEFYPCKPDIFTLTYEVV